ncbi:hypothetical protein ACYSNR_04365 [Enterococcus sp. LJL128]|uniref:hypothetical protein n=1 Tax=Enterococcus sp. LJL51 TaxID=3416656 RepID=UPI003CE6D79B
MSKHENLIQEGSSIPRTLEIDEIGLEFFDIPISQNILLVEGADDETVIETYYRLLSKTPPFEIRRASILDEDIVFDGKRNAIESYNNMKDKFGVNIKVLLDRDYDFLLNDNLVDENVFYYDYFELENYLFDDEIFEQFLVCSYPKREKYELNDILQKINQFDINENFIYLYHLNIFRELHFKGDTNTKLIKPQEYALFCSKINIEPIINGKIPEAVGRTIDERLINYITSNLDKIQQNLFPNIVSEVCSQCLLPTNIFELFRYYYKGKIVNKSVEAIFSIVLNSKLKCIASVKEILYRQWIPKSEKFNLKLKMIEESF